MAIVFDLEVCENEKLAFLLAMLLLLSGCAAPQAQAPSEPVSDPAVEETENVVASEPPAESSEPEQTEAPTDPNAPVRLTQQELEPFIELFHPADAESAEFVSCFLLPEYDSPEEINLFDVFLNGFDRNSRDISKTELKKLKAQNVMVELDVFRTKREDMDAILKLYTGYGLEDIQGNGLDAFVYLDEYDAYYIAAGGTNWGFYDILDGYRNADGTIVLHYESGLGIPMAVTLRPAEGESPFGYWFVSNLPV